MKKTRSRSNEGVQENEGTRSSEGRFAYEGLDRVIHERARLSVLTSLMTNPKGLTFNDLKELCALTDGNLSRHLQVLNQAKLVEIVKGYEKNRPMTICRMTATGRKRYMEYLTTLEQVVRDAANIAEGTRAPKTVGGVAISEA
jgi:DNA-binding MarR family transcriptional regulator